MTLIHNKKVYGRLLPEAKPDNAVKPPRAKAHFVVRSFHGKNHYSIDFPYEKSQQNIINDPSLVLDIPDKYLDVPNLLQILIRLYQYKHNSAAIMFRRLNNLDPENFDDAG